MNDNIELWDSSIPFPNIEEVPFPDIITHKTVEKAEEGKYHYLHEATLSFHNNRLYTGWANGAVKETNQADELYRGRVSDDLGDSWSDPYVIAPGGDSIAHNHGVMISHQGSLWCFVTRHDNKELTGVEGFVLNESDNQWESQGIVAKSFICFDRPKLLPNGNWIMAGENAFHGSPAVAISDGDNFMSWRVVAMPHGDVKLRYPETTVIPQSDGQLVAILRYEETGASYQDMAEKYPHFHKALVSYSDDNGETWSDVKGSNLPICPSQPIGGILSNGRRFLLFNMNHPENFKHKRNTLAIALTEPGKDLFSKIYKIRHGVSPMHSFYRNPQWAYPYFEENDGKLYVVYCANKSDCVLTIIPVSKLV